MKKYLLATACTLLAMPAFAQEESQLPPEVQQQMQQQMSGQMDKLQSMTPEEQQKFMSDMMNAASTLQACYDKVGGEAALKDLETRGQAMQAKVKELCAAGKRDEAQTLTMEEGKAIAADPRVTELKTCAANLLDQMPQLAALTNPETALAGRNVCDTTGAQPDAAPVVEGTHAQ